MRRLVRPLARVGIAAMLPVLAGTSVDLAAANPTSSCRLQSAHGDIQHVVAIHFGNRHFRRDRPTVPADLEQMPHLLNFIQGNGVLLANHHTALLANRTTDLLTALTGVYGDRHGVPVSDTFRYFAPDGTSRPALSFSAWTDPVVDLSGSPATDTTRNLLSADRKNAPAPWVPFTRAGCDVGLVAMGVALALHCAKGSAVCSGPRAEPDELPDEPGGYAGFQAVTGSRAVTEQLGPVVDLNGKPLAGVPRFDRLTAAIALSHVAAMQEHGVPVTYAGIPDSRQDSGSGKALGPGEAGSVSRLRDDDAAFDRFFTRLAQDGITRSNTLFVFTSDEGDHFVGGPAAPAACDGVAPPCTYKQIGELSVNVAGLLKSQMGVSTPFSLRADAAAAFYINGNPPRDAAATRGLERAVAGLTAVNPLTGNTESSRSFWRIRSS